MASEYIKTQREYRVATITVDNPENMNSLDTQKLRDFAEAIDEVRDARALIVKGSGDQAFIGGADLSYMADLDTQQALEMARLGHKVCNDLEEFPAPVIASIDGHAYGGGCEIALACDLRVASESASIGQTEFDVGIIPGWGGTQRLVRIVGDEQARRMVYFAKRLSAEEALDIGLVGEVVPDGKIDDHVTDMAMDLAKRPKSLLSAGKEALNNAHESHLSAGLTYERRAWATVFGEEPQREGMEAFLEKREPNWD